MPNKGKPGRNSSSVSIWTTKDREQREMDILSFSQRQPRRTATRDGYGSDHGFERSRGSQTFGLLYYIIPSIVHDVQISHAQKPCRPLSGWPQLGRDEPRIMPPDDLSRSQGCIFWLCLRGKALKDIANPTSLTMSIKLWWDKGLKKE